MFYEKALNLFFSTKINISSTLVKVGEAGGVADKSLEALPSSLTFLHLAF